MQQAVPLQKEKRMRRTRSKFIPTVLMFILCLGSNLNLVIAQSTDPTLQHYTMIDLTPAGATAAKIAAISADQQAGTASFVAPTTGAAENHAILWSGSSSSFLDLGLGSVYGAADGQQVGVANGLAALWTGSADSLTYLNPSVWQSSVAYGAGGGQQVGLARTQVACGERNGSCSSGFRTVIHPFMWTGSAASAIDLTPGALGFTSGGALGTDGIHQVGYAQDVTAGNGFGATYAMVWTGSADSAVNLNPPNSYESKATAVSGGEQVGYANLPHHATRWAGTAASAVDMHPAGYFNSEINATNGVQQAGFGLVAPGTNLPTYSHAMVWTGSAESAIDLHQFTPIGYTESAATGIDATGNIVGWASTGPSGNPATVHAVMWVPTEAAANFAQSVSLDRSTIAAGDSTVATVTLSQPAPARGAVVNLASSIYPGVGTTLPSLLTVSMPSSVTVEEGATTASFTVSTGVTALDGFNGSYVIDIRAAYGDTTQAAKLVVDPPLSLNSLVLNLTNLTGGMTSTGTVFLNHAAPAGGAVINLSSSNAAATVPSSVFVPAGQTLATFTVQTSEVTAFTNVTLTATYSSGSITVSRTAAIRINPPATTADTVSIQKADYVASKKELTVQASSTSATASLTVSVTATGQVIGFLNNKGGGSYAGTFSMASGPQNITVTSNLTGTASLAVRLK